jgi:CPA2 family monovalent cation:H+ antiporter-2
MNVILEQVDHIREDSYKVLRRVELPRKHLAERSHFLQDIETEIFLLKKDPSAHGRTLKDLDLRAKTGATIIAVQRKNKVFQNPPPNFILKAGDAVLLIGKKKEINLAMEYLDGGHLTNRGPE